MTETAHHRPECPRYGWAEEPALASHCTCPSAPATPAPEDTPTMNTHTDHHMPAVTDLTCNDCGGPLTQAFPTTDRYARCRRCGHVFHAATTERTR